jgi:AcrR family transcriptional regulator
MVPRLWNDTIDTHRRAVRDATLDAAAALVAEHGLRAVTMSQIAAKAGIGRATLYKYFPDVDAIVLAWHERQVTQHLNELTAIRDRGEDPIERLTAVLLAYADIAHRSGQHRDTELTTALHQHQHVTEAGKQLHDLICDLITEGVRTGDLRNDVAPSELAAYCLHALAAAGDAPSHAAISRLVTVTLAGLRAHP